MNLTLSIDQEILERARKRAEALGKSINQMVRDYLGRLAGDVPGETFGDELERLSADSGGRRRGWKFNREELHDRDDRS